MVWRWQRWTATRLSQTAAWEELWYGMGVAEMDSDEMITNSSWGGGIVWYGGGRDGQQRDDHIQQLGRRMLDTAGQDKQLG